MSQSSTDASLAVPAVAVASAIGVFGVVYGAVANSVLGPWLTIGSSVTMFSGAAQFTMVGLLAAGATPLAVLVGVFPLALRHLPLGVLVRPRVHATRVRRALLACFLTDETVGLALTRPESPARTMTVVGGLAYAAWIVGTGAGIAGASVDGLRPLADALFPVLFVGLAAVTVRSAGDAWRAVAAGACAAVVLSIAPEAGVLGALGVAAGAAAFGARL